MKKLIVIAALLVLTGCGVGRIKAPVIDTSGEPVIAKSGEPAMCEASFFSLFRTYAEIGGNACGAALAAADAKVDASLAGAVSSLSVAVKALAQAGSGLPTQ